MTYKELVLEIKAMRGYAFYMWHEQSRKRFIYVCRVNDSAIRYTFVKSLKDKGLNVYKLEKINLYSGFKAFLLDKLGLIEDLKRNKL